MTPAGAAAFQRFTHQKTSPSPSLQTRDQIWALCVHARLTFSIFTLKNFHPIYPNVTRRAFQGIAHCKIVGIAQASDSSRVNCTRHKLQIKSFALQRDGANCTLSSELQRTLAQLRAEVLHKNLRHSTELHKAQLADQKLCTAESWIDFYTDH